MSCCGTPRDPNAGAQNHMPPPVTPFHVNQQPSASPALSAGWPNQEKPFQPQGIPSPPPPIQPQMNGFDANRGSMYQPQPHGGSPYPPSHPGSPFQQPMNGTTSPYNNQYAPAPVSPPPPSSLSPGMPSQYNSMSSIQRPTPVLAGGYQVEAFQQQQSHTVSPSAAAIPPKNQNANNEGKLVVSIDFGTTMSGVAYGSTRIAGGKVQQVLNWPGTQDTYRKIPTCLLYDESGRVLAWGIEAKSSGPIPGTYKCEWVSI